MRTYGAASPWVRAVTPVSGAARVVSSASRVALALGYDVEAAFEELDP